MMIPRTVEYLTKLMDYYCEETGCDRSDYAGLPVLEEMTKAQFFGFSVPWKTLAMYGVTEDTRFPTA